MDESAEEHGRKSPEASRKGDSKSDVVISMPVPEMHSVGGVLAHMPQVHPIEKKKKNLLSLLSLTNLILFQSIHQLVITPAFKRHSSLSFYPLCVRNTFRNNKKTQHAVRLYEKKKKKYCVCARLSLSFFFHCEKWRFVNHLTR